jgi:hypothetical protein
MLLFYNPDMIKIFKITSNTISYYYYTQILFKSQDPNKIYIVILIKIFKITSNTIS